MKNAVEQLSLKEWRDLRTACAEKGFTEIHEDYLAELSKDLFIVKHGLQR